MFFCCKSCDEEYIVDLREDFNIDLKSKDHTTNVRIKRKGESNIKVTDNNGSILLPINVLAINENNGIIYLVYKIDDKENSIGIEYI